MGQFVKQQWIADTPGKSPLPNISCGKYKDDQSRFDRK